MPLWYNDLAVVVILLAVAGTILLGIALIRDTAFSWMVTLGLALIAVPVLGLVVLTCFFMVVRAQ